MKERISNGPLFQVHFVFIGFVLILFGVVLCNKGWLFLLGIPLMTFGLIVAANLEAVYIDYSAKRIYYYYNFIAVQLRYKSINISSYTAVSIGYENNLNEGNENYAPPVIISFEMYLVRGKKTFYLTEYGSHKEAVGLAVRMQEHLGVEIIDLVEIAISKAMKKKRR